LPRLRIAHSMGGAIALLCLHQHPELFAAAILSSPMLGLRIWGLPPALLRCITAPARAAGLEHCLVPGARRWRATRQLPEHSHLSRDEERCLQRHAWVAADPSLHVDEPTYGWLDSALALLPRIQNSEFLQGVRAPILIGTPEYDSVVSPEAQLRAADLLPNCTLVELAGSRHDPFLERDCIRDDWLHQIERFLVERLGSDAMRNRLPDYQLRTGSCTRQAA
jgi:lysophospholipase